MQLDPGSSQRQHELTVLIPIWQMNKLRLRKKSLAEYPWLVTVGLGLAFSVCLCDLPLGPLPVPLYSQPSTSHLVPPSEASVWTGHGRSLWSWSSLWPCPWAIHTGKAVWAPQRLKGAGTEGNSACLQTDSCTQSWFPLKICILFFVCLFYLCPVSLTKITFPFFQFFPGHIVAGENHA